MNSEKRKTLVAVILVCAAVLSVAAGGFGMSSAKKSSADKVSTYDAILFQVESARLLAEELGLEDVKIGEEAETEAPAVAEPQADPLQSEAYADNPEILAALEKYAQISADDYVADLEATIGRPLTDDERTKLVSAIDNYNYLCKNRVMSVTTEYVNPESVSSAEATLQQANLNLEAAQREYNDKSSAPAKLQSAYEAAQANTTAAQANYDQLSATAAASKVGIADEEAAYNSALATMESAKANYDTTNGKLAAYQAAVSAENTANAKKIVAMVSMDTQAQAAAQAEIEAAQAAQQAALSGYGSEWLLNAANTANKTVYESAQSSFQTAEANYNSVKGQADADAAAADNALLTLEAAKASEDAAKQAVADANAGASAAEAKLAEATAAQRTAQNWLDTVKATVSKDTSVKATVTDEDIAEAQTIIANIKTVIVNSSVSEEESSVDQNDILSALYDGKASSDREKLDSTVESLLAEPTIRTLSGSKATYSDVLKSAKDFYNNRIEKANDERYGGNTVALALIVCAVLELIAAGITLISKKSIVTIILAGVALAASVIGLMLYLSKGLSNALELIAFFVSFLVCVAAAILILERAKAPVPAEAAPATEEAPAPEVAPAEAPAETPSEDK